jgi:hypothetical protein
MQTNFKTFDKIGQKEGVGVKYITICSSSESGGTLDHDPITRITACHDVGTGVQYDDEMVNHINDNCFLGMKLAHAIKIHLPHNFLTPISTRMITQSSLMRTSCMKKICQRPSSCSAH